VVGSSHFDRSNCRKNQRTTVVAAPPTAVARPGDIRATAVVFVVVVGLGTHNRSFGHSNSFAHGNNLGTGSRLKNYNRLLVGSHQCNFAQHNICRRILRAFQSALAGR
jgi:hypothetical protein